MTAILVRIKSQFILKLIMNVYLREKKKLKISHGNQFLINKLNIFPVDYEFFKEIIIKIKLDQPYNEFGRFLQNSYYKNKDKISIYLDQQKIEKNYLDLTQRGKTITLIIGAMTDLKDLFKGDDQIQEIIFVKYNRTDIKNISGIFCDCKSLINLDISKIYSESLVDTSEMFCGCSRLRKINLSNFRPYNVKSMESMFCRCTDLEELILNNYFNTSNVENMISMFKDCYKVEELKLQMFNANSLLFAFSMFENCVKLKNLDISNFAIKPTTVVRYMFSNCSDSFKKSIRSRMNINDNAFLDY